MLRLNGVWHVSCDGQRSNLPPIRYGVSSHHSSESRTLVPVRTRPALELEAGDLYETGCPTVPLLLALSPHGVHDGRRCVQPVPESGFEEFFRPIVLDVAASGGVGFRWRCAPDTNRLGGQGGGVAHEFPANVTWLMDFSRWVGLQ